MKKTLVSPVVPPVVFPRRHLNLSASGMPDALDVSPLPLPVVPMLRTRATVYAMATLDCRGRAANQEVVRALRWAAGQRLDIHHTTGVLIVQAHTHAVFSVTRDGHVRLPAEVRHRCGLATGDRVLMAADPRSGQLVIYPPATVDAMLARHAADATGGETA